MTVLTDVVRDIRYAFRTFGRNRTFALAAIATLAAVLGANAIAFSAVHAILLRPLPFPHADRLVRLVENVPADESPSGRPERASGLAPAAAADWRRETRTLSHVGVQVPAAVTLQLRDRAVRLSGWHVSAPVLSMIETPPLLGRLFTDADDRAGAAPVAILGYDAWSTYFNRNPAVIGALVRLNDRGYTVVGVMPPGFAPFDASTDMWMPFVDTAEAGAILRLGVLARIRDGVSLAAAQDDADRLAPVVLGVPATVDGLPGTHRIEVRSWKDEMVAPVRRSLPMLMAAVTLILLIACVNVANLFTAHAIRRERELTVRRALGAGRWRLARQMLTESLTLVALGGIGGALLTMIGTTLIARFGRGLGRLDLIDADTALPRAGEIRVDGVVLGYLAALTLLVAIVCTAGALWRLYRTHERRVVPTAAATSTAPRRSASLLVVVQVSSTVVLTIGALLLIRSVDNLVHVDPGYVADGVITFQLAPRDTAGPMDYLSSQHRQLDVAARVLARLQSIPGIDHAAFTSDIPLVEGRFGLSMSDAPRGQERLIDEGRMLLVSPDYFAVMGMRILDGRGFTAADEQRSQATFVITKTLARAYFGAASPIGRRVSTAGMSGEVVGVLQDVRAGRLSTAPQPQLFMTMFQTRQFLPIHSDGLYFAVHTANTAAAVMAIRTAAREIAPDVPIQRIAPLEQIVASSTRTSRAYAAIVGLLAAGALALVAIGLYGIVAYLVGLRAREIAIRVALGAPRATVLSLVMRDGLAAVMAGASLGLVTAAALTPSLDSLLYGVSALDLRTFAAAPVLLGLIATVSAWLPARRALAIEPMAVLRND